MRLAVLQLPVSLDKRASIAKASEAVLRAAEEGARLVVLPEMFACPYATKYFREYSDGRGGEAYLAMSETAKEAGVTLIAGSVPELAEGKLYNTSFVFDNTGMEIARHRKVHLFDIDVKGGQRFFESDVLTAGDDVTLFEAEGHTFGLCICFDIRFPELFRMMALSGAEAVIVPAAFNMTTGPMHWELSFRMRAVDNQLFTVGTAPARDENGCYISYANSIVCDPWGNVIARAGTEEETLFVDIDFAEVESVRKQLPLLSARRQELYK